jgi:hypothetical protein
MNLFHPEKEGNTTDSRYDASGAHYPIKKLNKTLANL